MASQWLKNTDHVSRTQELSWPPLVERFLYNVHFVEKSAKFGAESVREWAIHCKNDGVNLGDLVSSFRIKNYIKQLGAVDEGFSLFYIFDGKSETIQVSIIFPF